MFKIRMGIPEMSGFGDGLKKKVEYNKADKNELPQVKNINGQYQKNPSAISISSTQKFNCIKFPLCLNP